MSLVVRWIQGLLVVAALAGVTPVSEPTETANGCAEHPSFGNIAGSRDTVVLSGRQASRCRGSGVRTVISTRNPEPYFTEQIVCSTDPAQAAAGLCSATPCPTSFFALRTIHF